MSTDWRDPTFLADVHAWIDGELARLGAARVGRIEQPHVYPWSTVLRVPTDTGDVWFKANAPNLAYEGPLVELLSARRPDVVPPLLALHERGWMLMSDAGEPLRARVARERDFAPWLEVLPLYASLQLDLEDDVDALLALGVPDLRLATLPERYARLLDEIDVEPRFRDAAPWVAELCEELASYGIRETIQHDDLHDGQVFLRDGRPRVLDWGDACISHPFFTLSVTLEGVLAWGFDDVERSVDTAPFRDAYLAPFARRYERDLAGAFASALRLGWVARAVASHTAGGDPQNTPVRLRMFLDGTPG